MKNFKRIMAIAGIVLLLSLYIVTFLLAIFGKGEFAGRLFVASAISTIAVPIFLWVFLKIIPDLIQFSLKKKD